MAYINQTSVRPQLWPGLTLNAGDRQNRPSYQTWIIDHGVVTDAGQDEPRSAGHQFTGHSSVRLGRNHSIICSPRQGNRARQRVQGLRNLLRCGEVIHDGAIHRIGEIQLQCPVRAQPLPMTDKIAQHCPTPNAQLQQQRRNGVRQAQGPSPDPNELVYSPGLLGVIGRPETTRRQSAHACCPRPTRQFNRHRSTPGITRKVRPVQPLLIEIALGRVDQGGKAGRPLLHRRPTAMAKQRRRIHLVLPGQQRNQVLPDASRAGCGMQKD